MTDDVRAVRVATRNECLTAHAIVLRSVSGRGVSFTADKNGDTSDNIDTVPPHASRLPVLDFSWRPTAGETSAILDVCSRHARHGRDTEIIDATPT